MNNYENLHLKYCLIKQNMDLNIKKKKLAQRIIKI